MSILEYTTAVLFAIFSKANGATYVDKANNLAERIFAYFHINKNKLSIN